MSRSPINTLLCAISAIDLLLVGLATAVVVLPALHRSRFFQSADE